MSRDEWIGQTAARRLQIRELRETGLSMRAIATEVGCSLGTVHNALKDVSEDQQ